MRKSGVGAWMVLAATGVVATGCSAVPNEEHVANDVAALGSSAAAHTRLAAIADRFQVRSVDPATLSQGPGAARWTRRSALPAGAAATFETSPFGSSHVRAVMAADAATRRAVVDLPRQANGAVHLEDATSHVRVAFALRGAARAEASQADGLVVYPSAVGGGDLVQRVHAAGTEDYVVFDTRPAAPRLTYDVALEAGVAGLRFVANTLEFVDTEGSPSLRIDPPYVVDADGARHAASLGVEGCAFDASPAAPWGRPTTPPGASHCVVHVTWGDVKYPALVDPSWTTTGAMRTRYRESAVKLPSGRVLVSGGYDYPTDTMRADAQIYNPGTNTFGTTGSLPHAKYTHQSILLKDGKVLSTGGDLDYWFPSPIPYSERYDEGTGTFVSISNLTASRTCHWLTALPGGDVLVSGSGFGVDAELFKLSTYTFTALSLSSFGTYRGSHTATAISGGTVLLTSGSSTSAVLYDPYLQTFTPTGSMSSIRVGAHATKLPSGRVLVFGGNNAVTGGTPLYTAEIYNPSTASFSATGNNMTAATFDNAHGVLLSTGKVLLVGYPSKQTMIFDETMFSGLGGFNQHLFSPYQRYTPSVVTLNSGKVLVAGGDFYLPGPTRPADLYTP